MRGARNPRGGRSLCEGIIPAYARSTQDSLVVKAIEKDHPRVCGEHLSRVSTTSLIWGSSPRLRRAPRHASARRRRLGIIPAYAGSTRSRIPAPPARGDHPRVCGEHSANQYMEQATSGSSPRMRGAQPGGHGGCAGPGIIPAYAGSTC